MDEQKKYEVIKSLMDHPNPNRQRAALTLGCTVRHVNRMLDSKGHQVHYRKGTKVMFIQVFDGRQYCCVNDKDIYDLEKIPEHETQSKNVDIDYTPPKPQKTYIPPMNHPWRRQQFGNFVKQQEHHWQDDKIIPAQGAEVLSRKTWNTAVSITDEGQVWTEPTNSKQAPAKSRGKYFNYFGTFSKMLDTD